MGKLEGDAMTESVGAAPDDAKRAQPRLIEYLKRVKSGIDCLRTLKMENSRENTRLQAMSQFIGGAHNLELPLRLSFKPEQASGDGDRDMLSIGGIKRRIGKNFIAILFKHEVFFHDLRLCRIGRKYREEATAEAAFARPGQIEMPLLAFYKEAPSIASFRKIQVKQSIIVPIENR